MKKSAKIYVVLLVWIAAALQFFINEKMEIDEALEQVYASNEEMTFDVKIAAWGTYGDGKYPEKIIKKILVNTGVYFGMESGVMSMDEAAGVKRVTFSGETENGMYRMEFVINDEKNESYLLIYTDNTKEIRRIRAFYNKLNIDYDMNIEVAVSGTENQMDDKNLEILLEEFQIRQQKEVNNQIYGKINTEVNLEDIRSDKNVEINRPEPGKLVIKFGGTKGLEDVLQKLPKTL